MQRQASLVASLTRWTWVWVDSGSWWWTGRPGVLQSMGSQSRTRLSDWTELHWTVLKRWLGLTSLASLLGLWRVAMTSAWQCLVGQLLSVTISVGLLVSYYQCTSLFPRPTWTSPQTRPPLGWTLLEKDLKTDASPSGVLRLGWWLDVACFGQKPLCSKQKITKSKIYSDYSQCKSLSTGNRTITSGKWTWEKWKIENAVTHIS